MDFCFWVVTSECFSSLRILFCTRSWNMMRWVVFRTYNMWNIVGCTMRVWCNCCNPDTGSVPVRCFALSLSYEHVISFLFVPFACTCVWVYLRKWIVCIFVSVELCSNCFVNRNLNPVSEARKLLRRATMIWKARSTIFDTMFMGYYNKTNKTGVNIGQLGCGERTLLFQLSSNNNGI